MKKNLAILITIIFFALHNNYLNSKGCADDSNCPIGQICNFDFHCVPANCQKDSDCTEKAGGGFCGQDKLCHEKK